MLWLFVRRLGVLAGVCLAQTTAGCSPLPPFPFPLSKDCHARPCMAWQWHSPPEYVAMLCAHQQPCTLVCHCHCTDWPRDGGHGWSCVLCLVEIKHAERAIVGANQHTSIR